MIVDSSGTQITCRCGTCKAVGGYTITGALVVWWLYASGGPPTDSMYLRATCDICSDTVDQYLQAA